MTPYLVYKRPSLWPYILVSLLSLCVGFEAGDWSAAPRFADREASIMRAVKLARFHADRIQESIKNGCYSFVMSKREGQ